MDDKKKTKINFGEIKIDPDVVEAIASIAKEDIEILQQKKIEIVREVLRLSLRGNYLPDILVKLGEFSTNTEARKYIKNNGILINGNLIKIIDYPINKRYVYTMDIKNTLFEVTIL